MLNSVMRKLSALALLAIGIVAGGVAAAAGPTVLTQPTNQPTCVYFPITIQSSGSYILGSNLVLPPSCDKNGVLINVDNVVLDLGGFSIIGRGGSGVGVGVSGANRSNIVVKDGSIVSMPGTGISLGTSATVTDLTVSNSGNGDGIQIANGTVRHVHSTGNKGHGIEATSTTGSSTVADSEASGNQQDGIHANSAIVSGNTVSSNHRFGISCPNILHATCTITGNVAENNLTVGISAVGIVTNNTANNNGEGGMGGMGQFTNNTSIGNGGDGIEMFNPSSATNNMVSNNDGFGISGTTTTIFGNNQIWANHGETDSTLKTTTQTAFGVQISPNICDGNTVCPGP